MKKRNLAKTIALTLTLATSLMTAPAFAEEAPSPPLETYNLEDVVVTATKTERPIDKVTQKVTVIGQDEISKMISGNRNIAELLMTQPGISINALSRNDANWGSYGGLGPKYNTYMIDGIPIDSFADAMTLDPAAFQQIESQRGSASVMYPNYLSSDFNGNQTPLTGTTNFRLRDKIDKQLTRISIGTGTFNTHKLTTYSQGSNGAWNFFMGSSFEKSDYANYGTPTSWLNMRKNPQYNDTKLYFKTTYFVNPDSSLSLFFNHDNHSGDAGRINRDYDHNYNLINFSYKNKVNEKLNTEFKVGYRESERRWAEDNADYTLREHDGVKQKIMPIDLTFTLKNSPNSTLTFGTDYQHATYETYADITSTTVMNKTNATNYGLFVQQENFNGPWTFRVGGRFNSTKNNYELFDGAAPGESSKSWNKFLWSTGARYAQSDKISWYANVGTSFVAPGAKQVGGTLKSSDAGVAGRNGQLPNMGLKPESGIATDIGFDYKINNTTKFGMRIFHNKVTDSIIDQAVSGLPAGTSQTRAINVGSTTSDGVELEYKQKLRPGFSWFANYTYTNAKITNPGQANDGSFVPFVPKNMVNVGFTWEKEKDYSVSLYDHYTSGICDGPTTRYDGYHLINANYQKYLSHDPKMNVKANLDLYNIANKKFEMPWGFQDTGFSAQASLQFEF